MEVELITHFEVPKSSLAWELNCIDVDRRLSSADLAGAFPVISVLQVHHLFTTAHDYLQGHCDK